MPRYFFAVRDHVDQQDDDGTELADATQARLHAMTFAGDILKNEPELISNGQELRVEVTNDRGERVVDVILRAEDRGGA